MTASPSALRRVLTHHRIIWWVLGVSLLLAWLGSLPARSAFGDLLDHSRAADGLVKGFDMGTWTELTNAPEIPFGALLSAAVAPMVVFLAYLIFLAGGIYAAYRSERALTMGEFFQACGAHFWRMLRLTLLSLVPFGILGAGLALLKAWSTKLEASPSERLSDYTYWAGLIVLGLLLLLVRAWFDLAQARTVALGERGMFKTALRSLRLLSLRLYGSYLGLAALRLAFAGVALWLWMKVPPAATTRSFLLLEAIVLAHIVTRLWQRAVSLRELETAA